MEDFWRNISGVLLLSAGVVLILSVSSISSILSVAGETTRGFISMFLLLFLAFLAIFYGIKFLIRKK